MKKYLRLAFLLFLVILLSSWGSKGHKKISQNAVPCIPARMGFLNPVWTAFVTNHASDADYRKSNDPNESPRHYIDIDNYPEFVLNGSIDPSYDTAVVRHGYSFVIDQGTLPWATIKTFDSLESCFRRGDWNGSAYYAADLGHYVGDGHQPFHITKNYDGQFTSQSGIHSRYETTMVGKYEAQLVYPVDSATVITDVKSYIFSYLYTNYRYVDSVLAADLYARQLAGNTSSTEYYQAMWSKTGPLTIGLMRHGSYSLASLIYTAWVHAGSPLFFPNGVDDHGAAALPALLQAYPDPASDHVTFPLDLHGIHASFMLSVFDMSGNLVDSLDGVTATNGINPVVWQTTGIPSGTYLCVLKSGSRQTSRKFIVAH